MEEVKQNQKLEKSGETSLDNSSRLDERKEKEIVSKDQSSDDLLVQNLQIDTGNYQLDLTNEQKSNQQLNEVSEHTQSVYLNSTQNSQQKRPGNFRTNILSQNKNQTSIFHTNKEMVASRSNRKALLISATSSQAQQDMNQDLKGVSLVEKLKNQRQPLRVKSSNQGQRQPLSNHFNIDKKANNNYQAQIFENAIFRQQTVDTQFLNSTVGSNCGVSEQKSNFEHKHNQVQNQGTNTCKSEQEFSKKSQKQSPSQINTKKSSLNLDPLKQFQITLKVSEESVALQQQSHMQKQPSFMRSPEQLQNFMGLNNATSAGGGEFTQESKNSGSSIKITRNNPLFQFVSRTSELQENSSNQRQLQGQSRENMFGIQINQQAQIRISNEATGMQAGVNIPFKQDDNNFVGYKQNQSSKAKQHIRQFSFTINQNGKNQTDMSQQVANLRGEYNKEQTILQESTQTREDGEFVSQVGSRGMPQCKNSIKNLNFIQSWERQKRNSLERLEQVRKNQKFDQVGGRLKEFEFQNQLPVSAADTTTQMIEENQGKQGGTLITNTGLFMNKNSLNKNQHTGLGNHPGNVSKFNKSTADQSSNRGRKMRSTVGRKRKGLVIGSNVVQKNSFIRPNTGQKTTSIPNSSNNRSLKQNIFEESHQNCQDIKQDPSKITHNQTSSELFPKGANNFKATKVQEFPFQVREDLLKRFVQDQYQKEMKNIEVNLVEKNGDLEDLQPAQIQTLTVHGLQSEAKSDRVLKYEHEIQIVKQNSASINNDSNQTQDIGFLSVHGVKQPLNKGTNYANFQLNFNETEQFQVKMQLQANQMQMQNEPKIYNKDPTILNDNDFLPKDQINAIEVKLDQERKLKNQTDIVLEKQRQMSLATPNQQNLLLNFRGQNSNKSRERIQQGFGSFKDDLSSVGLLSPPTALLRMKNLSIQQNEADSFTKKQQLTTQFAGVQNSMLEQLSQKSNRGQQRKDAITNLSQDSKHLQANNINMQNSAGSGNQSLFGTNRLPNNDDLQKIADEKTLKLEDNGQKYQLLTLNQKDGRTESTKNIQNQNIKVHLDNQKSMQNVSNLANNFEDKNSLPTESQNGILNTTGGQSNFGKPRGSATFYGKSTENGSIGRPFENRSSQMPHPPQLYGLDSSKQSFIKMQQTSGKHFNSTINTKDCQTSQAELESNKNDAGSQAELLDDTHSEQRKNQDTNPYLAPANFQKDLSNVQNEPKVLHRDPKEPKQASNTGNQAINLNNQMIVQHPNENQQQLQLIGEGESVLRQQQQVQNDQNYYQYMMLVGQQSQQNTVINEEGTFLSSALDTIRNSAEFNYQKDPPTSSNAALRQSDEEIENLFAKQQVFPISLAKTSNRVFKPIRYGQASLKPLTANNLHQNGSQKLNTKTSQQNVVDPWDSQVKIKVKSQLNGGSLANQKGGVLVGSNQFGDKNTSQGEFLFLAGGNCLLGSGVKKSNGLLIGGTGTPIQNNQTTSTTSNRPSTVSNGKSGSICGRGVISSTNGLLNQNQTVKIASLLQRGSQVDFPPAASLSQYESSHFGGRSLMRGSLQSQNGGMTQNNQNPSTMLSEKYLNGKSNKKYADLISQQAGMKNNEANLNTNSALGHSKHYHQSHHNSQSPLKPSASSGSCWINAQKNRNSKIKTAGFDRGITYHKHKSVNEFGVMKNGNMDAKQNKLSQPGKSSSQTLYSNRNQRKLLQNDNKDPQKAGVVGCSPGRLQVPETISKTVLAQGNFDYKPAPGDRKISLVQPSATQNSLSSFFKSGKSLNKRLVNRSGKFQNRPNHVQNNNLTIVSTPNQRGIDQSY